MPPLQQAYYDMLLERVRGDRHPSHQLLNRVEGTIWTAEQIVDYVDMLIRKAGESWYPSHQLLDRIDRMLLIASRAAL